MLCKHCGSEYIAMREALRPHKDYGYCSLDCMQADKSPCPNCGSAIIKRPTERIPDFVTRRFCCRTCAHSYYGRQKRTPLTCAKIRAIALARSPEHYAKVSASRIRYNSSPEGKAQIASLGKRHSQWIQTNSGSVQKMRQKQTESNRAHGTFVKTSNRMKAFYQTEQGEQQKQKYRRLYTGKPRSPHVTQKMKASLRSYWDSPKGIALREAISLQRTNGLTECPFGPGWTQQKSKIKRRDGKCVICGTIPQKGSRSLDVHHIYRRRLFGYVPGHNQNYVWANHPDNLITLCQSCHKRVEDAVIAVPLDYQRKADAIWQQFTTY